MLNGAEKNYSATELECLAVVWGIRHLRGYLEGYTFTVVNDHQALRWLQKMDSPTGRLGRWALELQQYTFNVQYRGGSLNRVADALSRRPHVNTIRPSQCTWYTRQIRKVIERSEDYPEYEIRDDFSATFYTPLISRKHRLRSSGKSAYLENKDFQRSAACTTIRPPDI